MQWAIAWFLGLQADLYTIQQPTRVLLMCCAGVGALEHLPVTVECDIDCIYTVCGLTIRSTSCNMALLHAAQRPRMTVLTWRATSASPLYHPLIGRTSSELPEPKWGLWMVVQE